MSPGCNQDPPFGVGSFFLFSLKNRWCPSYDKNLQGVKIVNELSFSPTQGLVVNNHAIKYTQDHHWQALVKRLNGRANIILTNEINLNANVENCSQMFAFHIPRSVGEALLKHATIKSRVSSWRMLGPLSRIAEKPITQGSIPATFTNGDIILLVYRSSQDAELSYMITYAQRTTTVQELAEPTHELCH